MNNPADTSYRLFIGGEWVDGVEGRTLESRCPANGELLSTFVDAGAEDVDRAVQAARKAYDNWKDVCAADRAAMLTEIARLIDEHGDHLAEIETLDTGKAIREPSWIDIPFGADQFRYMAGAVRTEEGRAVMIDQTTLSLVLREPIGVVGLIVPWNFPFALATWKLAPALAAGNTVVIKPSSETSLSLLELTKLMEQVLPPGVVNVVTGRGSTTGNSVLVHEGIRKISFTGSTEVGLTVARAAADRIIPATLELGGKSANIFFPDCNWKKAVEGAVLGILFNVGQVCCAGSRVFVHEDIYDRFLADCVEMFENVILGMPWDIGTQMGCLCNEAQLKKVLEYAEVGRKEGARVACGGYRITEGDFAKGFFVKPTILADVDNDMRVAREEIFGPVVCFIKFKTEDDVIRMANDSIYGLTGGVWTQDINRAIRVSRAVETGRMWVNCYNLLPAHAPFGGYKQSGIGRENHLMVLDAYSQQKNIMISLSEELMGAY